MKTTTKTYFNYSELNEESKNNAVNEYCELMKIPKSLYEQEVINWFNRENQKLLTENGNLRHWRKNI